MPAFILMKQLTKDMGEKIQEPGCQKPRPNVPATVMNLNH